METKLKNIIMETKLKNIGCQSVEKTRNRVFFTSDL